MKKILLLSLAVSLLSLSMTGCASDEADVNVPAETTTVAEETTTVLSDTAPETLRATPLPQTIDTNNLPEDCTLFASFEYGDINAEENTITVKVYDYELFDMVDISMLGEGDTIVLSGEDVKINSIERNDAGLITINGGLEEGGTYLFTDDNTVYFESGMNDMKTYYETGEMVLSLSPDMTYSVEPDYGAEPVVYSLDEFKNIPEEDYYFTPHNTQIHIKGGANGSVTKIERRWVP